MIYRLGKVQFKKYLNVLNKNLHPYFLSSNFMKNWKSLGLLLLLWTMRGLRVVKIEKDEKHRFSQMADGSMCVDYFCGKLSPRVILVARY